MFFRSASAPGEVAVAAAGESGSFFLSLTHLGVSHELQAEAASPPAKGHVAAFAFPTRDALFETVGEVYRKSLSLPTVPLDAYAERTAHLGDTESERLQKVRIGQGIFRDALLAYWNGICPITGITEPGLLRASHIIPWARCESDAERLNVHNGLLLSALWDAAFDGGLVSFGDDGRVLASLELSEAAATALCIDGAKPLPLTRDHRQRLAWHRTNIWRA
jgi:hypothetical protein